LENFKISKKEAPKVLTSKNEIQVFIIKEKKMFDRKFFFLTKGKTKQIPIQPKIKTLRIF
jgi:hypothetical protein